MEGMPLLELRVPQRFQEIVLAGEAAEHHVRQRRALAGVYVAECSVVVVRLQGKTPKHTAHVDLHEAGDQRFPFQRQTVHRHGDDGFFCAVRVFQGDFRSRDMVVVELVKLDIRPSAPGGVDQAVAVHESEFLQPVELLHARLVRLQFCHAGQVVGCEKPDGGVHVGGIARQRRGNDLCAALRQLVKIHQAHRVDSGFRVLAGVPARDDGTE